MIIVCDHINCNKQEEWDGLNECPAGWGSLILKNNVDILQQHYLCHEHVMLAYKLFNVISGSSPETYLLYGHKRGM